MDVMKIFQKKYKRLLSVSVFSWFLDIQYL
jgi:hypothetical protein